MTTPRRRSEHSVEDASEKICATLMAAVSERALRPGAKLMEEMLARRFGVSRTAVRGAIAILERAHIVEPRRNHGSFIAPPTAPRRGSCSRPGASSRWPRSRR